MEDQLTFDPGNRQGQIDILIKGAESWGKLPINERVRFIRRLRRVIAMRMDEIAEAISDECRRPIVETLAQEVLPALEMSRYCEKMFPRWFRPKNLRYPRPGFLMKRNLCYWKPLGLCAVITPGNWPFSLGMMSLVYLLLAGNTVVLKPSERSNIVAPLIAELLETAGITQEIAAVMSGGPEVGRWLASDLSVKKIFFFGQRKNGEEVASICNRIGKPYVLELGGGTTAIVCEDANLDVAARGVVWSGCYANGESCVSTNRVFVEEGIADVFLRKVKGYIEDVKTEDKIGGFVGPIGYFTSEEVNHQKELIEDALTRGAELICGGEAVPISGSKYMYSPALLTGVTPSMRIWSEEAYGPAIAVRVVDKAESVLDELRGDLRPLGVSIWTKDVRRAKEMASSLPVVMTWVNETSFGLPCLPWGGCGPTGKGSLFSEYSLHEVAELRTISIQPNLFNRPRMWWYPYSAFKEKMLRLVARFFYRS